MSAFTAHFEVLRQRVAQIMRYHLVHADDRDCEQGATISHYTRWDSCIAMLGTDKPPPPSDEGLSLWAGDSNCLNDATEGQALLIFAAHAITTAKRDRAKNPYYVSGKWPRSPSDIDRYQPDEIRDVPFLLGGQWMQLRDSLAEIYRLPELPISVGQARLRPVQRGAQIVSFCRELDRLDLWRNYAENGGGRLFSDAVEDSSARRRW